MTTCVRHLNFCPRYLVMTPIFDYLVGDEQLPRPQNRVPTAQRSTAPCPGTVRSALSLVSTLAETYTQVVRSPGGHGYHAREAAAPSKATGTVGQATT